MCDAGDNTIASMSRSQGPSSAPEEAGFTLRTERLGPLPLINHFIERIGLHETLSRFVPSDRRCAITHASALGVLLRSIIVEREPIYRQQETVHGFADGMFGISVGEMVSRAMAKTEPALPSHLRIGQTSSTRITLNRAGA